MVLLSSRSCPHRCDGDGGGDGGGGGVVFVTMAAIISVTTTTTMDTTALVVSSRESLLLPQSPPSSQRPSSDTDRCPWLVCGFKLSLSLVEADKNSHSYDEQKDVNQDQTKSKTKAETNDDDGDGGVRSGQVNLNMCLLVKGHGNWVCTEWSLVSVVATAAMIRFMSYVTQHDGFLIFGHKLMMSPSAKFIGSLVFMWLWLFQGYALLMDAIMMIISGIIIFVIAIIFYIAVLDRLWPTALKYTHRP